MNNDIRPPRPTNAPQYPTAEGYAGNAGYRDEEPVHTPLLSEQDELWIMPAAAEQPVVQPIAPTPQPTPQVVPMPVQPVPLPQSGDTPSSTQPTPITPLQTTTIASPIGQQQTSRPEFDASPENTLQTPPPNRRRSILTWGIAIVAALLISVVAAYAWYQQQLSPVSSDNSATSEQVKIDTGTTPDQIAATLHEKGLISSKLAFHAYTRLSGTRGQLKAGSYIISPTESMEEIVKHLVTGRMEEFTVTFYPGAALNVSAPTDNTPSHREVLKNIGYDDAEIDEAFKSPYDHPLVASAPRGSDIEGFLYGETYQIAAGSSVKEIVRRTFDEFYTRLEREGVLAALESKNMSLYDAIILASIVEREVSSDTEDQRRVAQVFFSRLEAGMPLGADATFVYAASKMGTAPSVDLESPYNTRKYGGLPPGPISSPGVGAVKAVANPADTDFIYFVSGDDGKNYFSRTLDEHEAATRKYCQKNCSLF